MHTKLKSLLGLIPTSIKWGDVGVEFPCVFEKAEVYLKVKSSSLPLLLIPHVHVMGVNHEKPESSLKIARNAI
ncbi:hypothetical protein E2I00_000210 [Balaenoptera physalus]|uniref:Uncharacterized protein n=1 Tax=Balaenoptera physalus TaxID=9770 RepID=A0A6A1QB33_BALPH|nr:hypothetical protein E2I00_000210 [Balaenoptera physalus]